MPSVRVLALAKINLCLEVLNRRSDAFHNIRTIFQTISLADAIDITAEPSGTTNVQVESSIMIPGENLMVRATEAVLTAVGATADVRCRLRKRIPMGGGLGGGSTDAAAVLLALPGLMKRPLPIEKLIEIGSGLGSDVPFFLFGGTALGLGRGTEVYPLNDAPPMFGLLVAPPIQVSTPEAYAKLGRTADMPDRIGIYPSERLAQVFTTPSDWSTIPVNDFEEAVFERHPELGTVKRKLKRLGAHVALMTGSGAGVYGLFSSGAARNDAAAQFARQRVFKFSLISGRVYRALWHRSLQPVS